MEQAVRAMTEFAGIFLFLAALCLWTYTCRELTSLQRSLLLEEERTMSYYVTAEEVYE